MGIFDFDPEKMNQEAENASDKKMWLNVANSAANNILSTDSAAEILMGQKRNKMNVGLDKVADSISDPWEKQKKTFEAYKAAKDGQSLESDSDPNSASNKALDALLVSKYKVDPAKLQGLTKSQKTDLFGNPGKLAEIEAQSQINFQNEMTKQKASQDFTASENTKSRNADFQKENLKRTIEQAKKNDPNERLKGLSGTDKARYDNALMVANAIDEMGSALDEGENTFSLVGDNKYTAAERKAAEAYGRMQSGGAINKDEENRFLAMLPRKMDSKEMQRSKLVSQRNEMVSRLKTLGFTPEEAGYAPKEFKYGTTEKDNGRTVVKRQVNQKTGQTRVVYSDGSVEEMPAVAGGR